MAATRDSFCRESWESGCARGGFPVAVAVAGTAMLDDAWEDGRIGKSQDFVNAAARALLPFPHFTFPPQRAPRARNHTLPAGTWNFQRRYGVSGYAEEAAG